MKKLIRGQAWCAMTTAVIMTLQPVTAAAADNKQLAESKQILTAVPPSSPKVMKLASNPKTALTLSHAQKLALLQANIKYVFVLFQENRSFDFYFGTYPGAAGIFSGSPSQIPGFNQPLVDTTGSVINVSPFLIPQTALQGSTAVNLYPEDTDSVNHGHAPIDNKMDFGAGYIAKNDRYAFVEEGLTGTLSADGTTYTGPAPTLAQKQHGELVMGHVDCNTAPFMWNYADSFVLFDQFFDTVIGPSTPNALAMIAGQSGITEWVRHPELGSNNISTNFQLPVTGDPQPFWGSALDTYNVDSWPTESGAPGTSSPAANQTYASLPLSFMGQNINTITSFDNNAAFDLQDVQQDITKIAGDNNAEVNWGWFQQGYDHEPTDTTATATHGNYIAHHAAPQYFGYIANNGVETQKHMFGLNDFYNTINNAELPSTGGVFYVRGGYGNNDGLVPRSPSPAVKAAFKGNDDHPGYSDLQISETLIADSVNAIANSPYWSQSVIIITYDESDGLYDHAQPEIYNLDPKGSPLEQGPRIPAIVISPYAATHVVSHEVTNHGSIIKFIDELFKLTPLAQLPDEAAAQQVALQYLGLPGYTPTDDPNLPNGDLFSAFDDGRLSGTTPPVPATYAYLPTFLLHQLPHLGGQGCSVLGITPTDYVSNGGVIDPAPADFNPRPGTNPGLPTTPGWPTN